MYRSEQEAYEAMAERQHGLEAERDQLIADLARVYRETGDIQGDAPDDRVACHAIDAVIKLRKHADNLEQSLAEIEVAVKRFDEEDE